MRTRVVLFAIDSVSSRRTNDLFSNPSATQPIELEWVGTVVSCRFQGNLVAVKALVGEKLKSKIGTID